MARILLPTLIPSLARLSARRGVTGKLGAGVLLVVALAILILIGQTVPVLLACLGLAVGACCCRACAPPCWRPASWWRC